MKSIYKIECKEIRKIVAPSNLDFCTRKELRLIFKKKAIDILIQLNKITIKDE